MNNGSVWWLPVLLGVLLIPGGGFVISQFPQSAHDIADSWGAPVYAFEFARDAEDLNAVVGPPGDADRDRRIAEMKRGTCWDFPFLVLYAAFMASMAVASLRAGSNRIVALTMLAFAVLSGVFDAVENVLLLAALDSTRPDDWLGVSILAVNGKFVSISLAVFLAACLAWRMTGLMKYAAMFCLASSAMTLVVLFEPERLAALLGPAVAVGWIAMLAIAIARMLAAWPRDR